MGDTDFFRFVKYKFNLTYHAFSFHDSTIPYISTNNILVYNVQHL